MKRDMDLIRAILLDIETRKSAYERWDAETFFKGKDVAVVVEHLNLLIKANFLTGKAIYSPQENTCSLFGIDLTWNGHEFLSLSRENRVWEIAKKKIIDAGLAFSMPLLMGCLKNIAKKYLNFN